MKQNKYTKLFALEYTNVICSKVGNHGKETHLALKSQI